MLYEHRPRHFDVDMPFVHGTFEPLRIEVAQIPCPDLADEDMASRGWSGLTDPSTLVVGTVFDARDTVGQAAAGIDGTYLPGGGAIRAEWWASIPDDGPPQLRLYAFVEGNTDGILIIDCDPVRDYVALNVLSRRQSLLIDSHRISIGGVPVRYSLLVSPVPTEGLRQVADYLLDSSDQQDELWWKMEGQQP